jgi:hypothetical protein
LLSEIPYIPNFSRKAKPIYDLIKSDGLERGSEITITIILTINNMAPLIILDPYISVNPIQSVVRKTSYVVAKSI